MILAHNNYSRTHPYFLQQHPQHNTTNNFDSNNHGLAPVSQSTYNLHPSTSFGHSTRQITGNQYKFPSSSPFDSSINSQSLNQVPDLMPSSESWLVQNYQQTPRATHRMGHNRESSLSSLNSNGPASPYNTNISNPHVAINDSTDSYHDLASNDSNYSYQLGKPMINDNFYASIQGIGSSQGSQGNGMSDMSFTDGLPNMSGSQQQQKRFANDRGLLPAADVASLGSRSVASSTTGGDSQPATPSFQEPAEDDTRRRKNVFQNVPKLDRTMTDVYSDELYSPHFTITSASPQPQAHADMSPNSGLFAERLALANNQRLSAVQSPVSSTSRTTSPFRQGSPLAPSLNDFSQAAPQIRLNSAQQMREKQKQERDAQALEEQLSRTAHQQQGTPSTISPKDALLDFNESDDGSDFPLFPPQETNNFDLNQLSKSVPQQQQQQQQVPQIQQRTPLQTAFDFSMPSNVQMPQQYPFVSRPRQQQASSSEANFSRMSSADTSGSNGSDGVVQRPMRTAADGGTYTCTYHGCTLRFDTPQLLQKHKREGHRQANALTPTKPVVAASPGLPDTLLGSQAGPHRCDRINPSTGKPCTTVFSRPYDLTRHEDTIHNARKKKVRCNLCTEEKTFSRADALTRHYRVCHPDVEFPGKHRRRGGSAA